LLDKGADYNIKAVCFNLTTACTPLETAEHAVAYHSLFTLEKYTKIAELFIEAETQADRRKRRIIDFCYSHTYQKSIELLLILKRR